MHPMRQKRMKVVERQIHTILAPMGFHKTRVTWRRQNAFILQQFSIGYMQIEGLYRPEWGLNLLRFRPSVKPLAYQLQVRWTFEDCVSNLDERLLYFDAFDMNDTMQDTEREALIGTLMRKYVVPCFELFDSEKAVRAMVKDRKTSCRASILMDFPDDWYPPLSRD